LAASLIRYGYLARDVDGRFRLGPSLWRLGSIYRRGFELGEAIRPELRALAAATGETASFYVRDGDERLCLYRENSRHEVRHHLDEGSRLPLDRGAPAHILRAWSGAADLSATPAAAEARKAGFYISVGERSPEVSAVAAPVFGAGRALRGALTVSGLTSRFGPAAREAAAQMVVSAARRLSEGAAAEQGAIGD
jgi:DNA-binding IclR family transcriptional regulator